MGPKYGPGWNLRSFNILLTLNHSEARGRVQYVGSKNKASEVISPVEG